MNKQKNEQMSMQMNKQTNKRMYENKFGQLIDASFRPIF